METMNSLTTEFIGRIAVAVWIGRLSEEAACAVLDAYTESCQAACRPLELRRGSGLRDAVYSEYRHRREGQELCS